MAKYNTLHYCTVSASILLRTGPVYPTAANLLLPFIRQYDNLLNVFRDLKRSILSSENKAVYGREIMPHGLLSTYLLRKRKTFRGLDTFFFSLESHSTSLLFQ